MVSVRAPQVYRTGTELALQIRAATEYDERELIQFFDKVSDEDRRFRFQCETVGRLDREQARPLVGVDHHRTESFLAFEMTAGELVATGQLMCDDSFDTAEVAVSVRADFKGQGIGWLMLDILTAEAERRGVRKIVSVEDRANSGAIDLEREKGFVAVAMTDDPTRVLLSKELV